MPTEDSRETCVLSILRKEGSAITQRIIELASTPEFEQLCRDCKSGVEVYDTTMKLHRAGIIARRPATGGFLWSLANQNEVI